VRTLSAKARARVVVAVGLAGTIGCAIWASSRPFSDDEIGLLIALAACAIAADFATATWDGPILVSGSFVPLMIAVGFLGPLPAFAIAVAAELTFWTVDRYRAAAFPMNAFGTGGPVVIAAVLFQSIAPEGVGFEFYAALAAAAALFISLNFITVACLSALLHGDSLASRVRAGTQIAPAVAINLMLAVAAAAIYESVGLGAVVFVLVSIFAFTYMARLVVTARERTRQYAALSWGVLSGLIRTLDLRDARAARHAAAVAAFSRDIAQAVGMSSQECELAHTAGLLHDIGRFGLSDRVMERGRTLTEQDWETIRRHPEMGADLLRDLGIYGPVAEIVRSHHERIDGRGYPRGLAADEIPELAKIVSVAEVYDTLTADDTYRTPVSSFEALNELRRVSGSQLDGRYVEALAELLAGRGVEYRHADRADFDEELDVQRRISEAVGAPQPEEAEAAGTGD
jgi:putative nucleotidyltransferase with HDIG domain